MSKKIQVEDLNQNEELSEQDATSIVGGGKKTTIGKTAGLIGDEIGVPLQDKSTTNWKIEEGDI